MSESQAAPAPVEPTAVQVLMEIRDALLQIRDVLAYVAMPPAPTASTACTHPDDQRVNLSSMGETRWKCKTCKYEHSEPRLAAAPT